MAKIVAMLTDPKTQGTLAQKICDAGTKLLGADGVSLSMVVKHSLHSTASSNELYGFLDEQQFAFGQGPTFDASLGREPVVAHDLASQKDFGTWPIFTPIAQKNSIHSMAAFPMRIGTSSLGVLTAYRKGPIEISATQLIDALNLSELAASMLIQQLAGQADPNIHDILSTANKDQSVLHLAAGMVAEKLGITIIEAMVRIRAHAYKTDEPLFSVASKIASHNLELEA